MSKKDDIKQLIEHLHARNGSFDTTWLESYLGGLGDEDLKAAIPAIKQQADWNKWDDIVRPAQEAVDKNQAAKRKPPGDALLEALHLSKDDWKNISTDQQGKIFQIADFLDAVNQEQRDGLLTQLSSNVPSLSSAVDPFGGAKEQLTSDKLGSLLQGMQAATGTDTQQAHSQAQQTAMDPLQWQPGQTDVQGPQKEAFKKLTGQDFDTAYKNFTDNYAVKLQTYNPRTQSFQPGTDSLWSGGQTQTLQPGQAFGGAQATSGMSEGDKGKYKITEAQFLQYQAGTSLSLASQVENDLAAQWSTAHGGVPLPDDLRGRIYDAVGKMSPEVLATYSQGSSGGVQAVAQALEKDPDSPVSQAYTSYVSQGGTPATHASLDTEFQKMLGRPASPQDIAALQGATTKQITDYIDNLPQPGAPGIKVGTYNTAESNMKSLWQEYYGQDPTKEDVSKFAGWGQEDISRWVLDQPSKSNPGMKNGERKAYLSMADAASQKYYGTPADSRMVDMLSGLVKK